MAEVLAAPAAIAAVFQYTSYGIKLGRALKAFINQSGLVHGEIQSIITQTRTFRETVVFVQATLQRHCDTDEQSPVLGYLRQHDVLGGIKEHARIVKRQLKDAELKVKSMRTSSKLWAAVQWLWNRESFLQLSPQMESVKMNLNLIVSVILLEVATQALQQAKEKQAIPSMSSRDTRRLEREIQSLKLAVESQVGTIEYLNSQVKRMYSEKNISPPPFLRTGRGSRDPLVELGQSMVEGNSVPYIPQRPSPPAEGPRASEMGNTDSGAADDSGHDQDANSASRSMPSAPRTSTDWSEIPASQDSARTESLRLPSDDDNEPSTFTAVRAASQTLRLDAKTLPPGLWGYIRHRDQSQLVQATIDQTLDGNVMSTFSTKSYGLVVDRPEDPTDGPEIVFDSGDLRSTIGIVSFRWRDRYYHGRKWSMAVHCYICDYDQPLLVLGRPFVEKRQHYLQTRHRGGASEGS